MKSSLSVHFELWMFLSLFRIQFFNYCSSLLSTDPLSTESVNKCNIACNTSYLSVKLRFIFILFSCLRGVWKLTALTGINDWFDKFPQKYVWGQISVINTIYLEEFFFRRKINEEMRLQLFPKINNQQLYRC